MSAHPGTTPPAEPTPPRPTSPEPRARARRGGRVPVIVTCGLLVLAALVWTGPGLYHRLTTTDPARSDDAPRGGYTLTVYFTPSEAYYDGPRRDIRDKVCPGEELPDAFPADYLERVDLEGFGRTARGDYLGWDFDEHCYFATDEPPVGSHDNALVPWRSVAANHLPYGTEIRIGDCGPGVPGDICARVKAAHWRVDDLCSIGCDDTNHLDLYIGEQTRADLEDEDYYFVTEGATVRARAPEPKG
ncbi:hypothetical protein [Streptomyces sp. CRN 30]|uniref:hypothetical protein n=1 Tax=Streptomyces sp. CRN 30 TaxID=3075613 RepID=UPI002A836FC6|nr:hypothetical protein [Streptomyces sp. CRN 30]